MTDETKQRRKKILAILGVILFVALMAVLSVVFSREIKSFFKDPESLRAWVAEKGFLARLAFVGIVILQVVVAFIPGEPVEIAAGVLFGVWEGTLLCLIGATVGSCMVFLFVKKWGVKVVELFFSPEEHGKLKFLHQEKRLKPVLFLLLCIPGTPKDLISYFAGLTSLRFFSFLWITFVARIPSVITSTWGGSAFVTKNWFLVAGIFAGTAAISLLGMWLYGRIVARRDRKKGGEAPAAEATPEAPLPDGADLSEKAEDVKDTEETEQIEATETTEETEETEETEKTEATGEVEETRGTRGTERFLRADKGRI